MVVSQLLRRLKVFSTATVTEFVHDGLEFVGVSNHSSVTRSWISPSEQRASRLQMAKKPRIDSSSILQEALKLADVLKRRPNASVKKAVSAIRASILQMVRNPKSHPELELPILAYSYACTELLPDYATLHYQHVVQIHRALNEIKRYDNDPTLQRPLNFLLLASPGSGKSQLIKSIAKRLGNDRVGYVPFNMATMESKDDLGRVLDAARNVAIDRKLPLIFLDEFDSRESNYPLLLPLLWDAELDVAHRDLRLGRSVFFLAGSRSTLPEKLARAREMISAGASPGDDTKLVDLFSRINGTAIELPSLAGIDEDPVPDKIVLTMNLLRRRFPACEQVPWALLWFVAQADFRYEVRSIATLINQIPLRAGEDAEKLEVLTLEHVKRLRLDNVDAPGNPLAFHLVHSKGSRGIKDLWNEALAITATQRLRVKSTKPAMSFIEHWSVQLPLMLATNANEKRARRDPARKTKKRR